MTNVLHIVLALVLVVLLVLLTDPFMNFMPAMGAMFSLVGATVLLIIFAGFVMFERASDEREVMHRMNAGRIAYLSGIAVLTVGLLVEGLTLHHVNPWIAGALGIMVVSKLIARFVFEHRG